MLARTSRIHNLHRAFLRHLDEHRDSFQHNIMLFRVDKSCLANCLQSEHSLQKKPQNLVQREQSTEGCNVWSNTRLDRMTFVDDHIEMWATRSAKELRDIFAPLVPTQKEYNLETNFAKTQIAIVPRGRGAAKRLKSVSYTHLTLPTILRV